MFTHVYTAIPALPRRSGPDIRYPLTTYVVAEGGAGDCDGVQVAQSHVGGWTAHLAAYPTGLDAAIDEVELAEYLDYVIDNEVSEHFASNFYENLLYGDNRDFHLAECVKVLSAAKDRGLFVHHYGFPSWNATDEQDDYAWAEIGPYLNSVSIVLYMGYPGGTIQAWEYARYSEEIRKAQRLANGRPIHAWVSAYTHGGDEVEAAKVLELKDWIKTQPIDVVFVWSDKGDTAANTAIVSLYTAEIMPVVEADGDLMLFQTKFDDDTPLNSVYYTVISVPSNTVRIARTQVGVTSLSATGDYGVTLTIEDEWLPCYIAWDDGTNELVEAINTVDEDEDADATAEAIWSHPARTLTGGSYPFTGPVDPNTNAVSFVAGDAVTCSWTVSATDYPTIVHGDATVLRFIPTARFKRAGGSAAAEVEIDGTASISGDVITLSFSVSETDSALLTTVYPADNAPTHHVQVKVSARNKTPVEADGTIKRSVEAPAA